MRRMLVPALVLALVLVLAAAAHAQVQVQVPDTTYVPKVAKPAFTKRHPVVMVDEAHHDYFTVKGYYRGLAALLEADGLRVVPGVQPFSPARLESCQILVVADACGAEDPVVAGARNSAFRPWECDVVRDWVRQGGSLLLIADSSPYASAMDSLARRFGVDMAKGYTVDTRRVDPEMNNLGCILYRREMDMLGDHAILRGRDPSERVSRLVTFSGQSLTGPPGSRGLLRLGPSSWDVPFTPDSRRATGPVVLAGVDTTSVPKNPGSVPAMGRFQGLAFSFGRGRVVVLADGAMLSAQFLFGAEARHRGKDRLRIGLNRTDLDNERFALNVVRWLGRALD
jgi:hypothetical protein